MTEEEARPVAGVRCSARLLAAAQRGLSSLELQPGLCEEGTGQMRLLSQAPDSEIEFLVQLVQVPAHQVAHLEILQVMPAPFVPGVEVGGVARQDLQPHPAPRARYELLDLQPPMDRRAVPDHR